MIQRTVFLDKHACYAKKESVRISLLLFILELFAFLF